MTVTTKRRVITHAPAAPVRHSLAEVPDTEYHTSYVGRSYDGIRDYEILRRAHAGAHNVLLEGPTGPGKTSLVLAYAAYYKLPYYSVSSNVGVDPSQLFGKMLPDGAGGWHFFDGGVTTIFRGGGVLLINELNFLPERIATVLFSGLDKRRSIALLDHKGEVVRAHKPPWGENTRPCWCPDGKDCPLERAVLIVGDMNPDYEGTRPLNKALRNRFAIQIDWDYDDEVESKLVRSEELLGLARRFRQLDNIDTPVTTNMLQEFEAFVVTFGLEFAVRNFIQHFGTDERESIATVFTAKMDALKVDFAKPIDDGFGNVFSRSNAQWAQPKRRLRV